MSTGVVVMLGTKIYTLLRIDAAALSRRRGSLVVAALAAWAWWTWCLSGLSDLEPKP
jgi:hypothetical protein